MEYTVFLRIFMELINMIIVLVPAALITILTDRIIRQVKGRSFIYEFYSRKNEEASNDNYELTTVRINALIAGAFAVLVAANLFFAVCGAPIDAKANMREYILWSGVAAIFCIVFIIRFARQKVFDTAATILLCSINCYLSTIMGEEKSLTASHFLAAILDRGISGDIVMQLVRGMAKDNILIEETGKGGEETRRAGKKAVAIIIANFDESLSHNTTGVPILTGNGRAMYEEIHRAVQNDSNEEDEQ